MSWYNPTTWSADDWKRAGLDVATGGSYEAYRAVGGVPGLTKGLGLAHDPAASAAESEDAEQSRKFAEKLREAYANAPVNPQAIGAASLDQAYANQARDTANRNIADLEGVASGRTPTAANAMFTQGTDQAAARARGLAAAYSRNNPGAALRMGLAAGNQAQLDAASQAAQLKANEQAAARNAIGQQAGAMRTSDLAAAARNQDATMDAAKANQQAALSQQQINNQTGQLAMQATGVPLNAQIEHEKAVNAVNNANAQATASTLGSIGTTAAALSDERAKRGIRTKKLADAYAEKLHGVSFGYKPGEGDGGEHSGLLAQDVEKVVPTAVHKDSRGMRMVDTNELTMTNAAALAEIAKRVRELEARGR